VREMKTRGVSNEQALGSAAAVAVNCRTCIASLAQVWESQVLPLLRCTATTTDDADRGGEGTAPLS
jgi:hypothetical protein